MKRQEKQETLKAPAIGYYSGLGGLAIKRIEYGADDFAVFTAGEFTGRKTAHKARIDYSGKAPFFKFSGVRVRFDEIMRA